MSWAAVDNSIGVAVDFERYSSGGGGKVELRPPVGRIVDLTFGSSEGHAQGNGRGRYEESFVEVIARVDEERGNSDVFKCGL